MIIISLKILGNYFIKVALVHAEYFADQNGYDKNKVAKELNSCNNLKEFKKVYDNYFSDEIKLRIEE